MAIKRNWKAARLSKIRSKQTNRRLGSLTERLKQMSRKMIQFQVSADLIKEALAMPGDTQIYNIIRHDYNPDVFVFFVEHPDFGEILEASAPPELSPIITADYDKKPSTWLTFEWGKPIPPA